MTETLADDEVQEIKLQEAEADRQYFWRELDIENADSLAPDDKRLIFNVPLLVYASEIEQSRHYPEERNQRVKAFEQLHFWPKSAAEVRMIAAEDEEGIFDSKGPEERLRRATHTHQGERSRAQKSTYETMSYFVKDAVADRSSLIAAKTVSGLEIAGNIKIIRSDTDVLNTIADYLHGREILDRGLDYDRNTNNFKQREKYWRGFMQAAARPGFASDAQLLAIYNTVWESARARAEYWGAQKEAAYKKIGHVLVDDVQEKVISVRVDESPPEESDQPKPSVLDGELPWENYVPPTPVGKNYEIEGLGDIQVVEKAVTETLPVREIVEPVLPEPLFDTRPQGEKKKKKSKKKPRTKRSIGLAGMNTDEPPPHIPDARRLRDP